MTQCWDLLTLDVPHIKPKTVNIQICQLPKPMGWSILRLIEIKFIDKFFRDPRLINLCRQYTNRI